MLFGEESLTQKERHMEVVTVGMAACPFLSALSFGVQDHEIQMDGKAIIMSTKVHYICQSYDWKKRRGKSPPVLEVVKTVEATSQADATKRAERIHEIGSVAGVDAYMVEVDEEAGDYGEPEFFTRLGEVPNLED